MTESGTLYIDISNDTNPGEIKVEVRQVSSSTDLYTATVPSGGKTGPQVFSVEPGNYVVTISWPHDESHVIGNAFNSDIATCNPPTAKCALHSWLVRGSGASASFPVKVG